jgi:hypothetical protein
MTIHPQLQGLAANATLNSKFAIIGDKFVPPMPIDFRLSNGYRLSSTEAYHNAITYHAPLP